MTVIKPEMISDKVIRKDLLPLSFLKKSAYTGSKRRMNYKLEKTEVMPEPEDIQAAGDAKAEAEQKPVTVLRVYAWEGPFSFDNTDPEQIESTDVEFSDAGIAAAIEFLNEQLPRLGG